MKSMKLLFLLPLRTILFLFIQACIALGFLFAGSLQAWSESEKLWILSGLGTNVILFVVLLKLFRSKNHGTGKYPWFNSTPFRVKDLIISLGLMVACIPIAFFPNYGLAGLLFATPETAFDMFYRPIPFWVIGLGFFWALTQGMVELPYYFGYIMPGLAANTRKGWAAWALTSFFLALQHVAIPFIPDWNFVIWRFGMFFPFALFLGLCFRIRPALMPYFMIFHALLDVSAVMMYLGR